MPVVKLKTNNTPDAMKLEGNYSVDTLIRQATGKEPFLSFSRTGDSPVQWIQLLQSLDQPDLPGWPLLTPPKVQMQKCDKCSREFCSPINYRRHIRVHRRSLNVDKESHKNRDLLGAFWDELSADEAEEILSFKDVTLENVPGSSVIRVLASSIHKPGFCALPQEYVKAGSMLLDIIQARPSGYPLSSQKLFSILDDASERTFLCAGTAESMQKYVFDGEAGKIGLEMKNLVACMSFLIEQKLVKAWLANKDAEALRCQKLLVEEEEAAQKKQAQLLERKRQKKLRQKEQKAKDQSNGENSVSVITLDPLESPPSAETSISLDLSVEISTHHDPHLSNLEPEQISNKEDNKPNENPDSITPHHVEANVHRHSFIARWKASKSGRAGRNGFHESQNQLEPVPKPRLNKVWTRKPKPETEGDKANQTGLNSCELVIGSISVPLENLMHMKNDVQKKMTKIDSVQTGPNKAPGKLWRPVSRHQTIGLQPVQSGNQESEECDSLENGDRACRDHHNVQPGPILFSRSSAKGFLVQRWKEAVLGDHIKLVLSSEPEASTQNNYCPVREEASDLEERSILGNAENRLVEVGPTTRNPNKPKFRTNAKNIVKIKYIPKPKLDA